MDNKRYKELMDSNVALLTAEEGRIWHFCWDWDGLLVEKDSPEFECCTCVGGARIRGLFDDPAIKDDPASPAAQHSDSKEK